MTLPRAARLLAPLVLLSLGLTAHPAPVGADTGGGETEPVNRVTACGVERWAVKTGIDTDARTVNQKIVVSTTIAHLRGLPAPHLLPLRQRVRPVETTVWRITAILLRYKQEADSDYHLVLADSGGRTLIAEIPAPPCVGASSPFLPAIRGVRRVFAARFHPTDAWQRVQVPVTVTGVGFFDFRHGQSGVAPNAIELHPVLSIRWSGGASGPVAVPTVLPARTPQAGPPPVGGALRVRVQVAPNPTTDGTETAVSATTAAGAACTVSVLYASGHTARSRSLEATETASSAGTVSWSWTPDTTTPGQATATVQCTLGSRSGSGTVTFTVR